MMLTIFGHHHARKKRIKSGRLVIIFLSAGGIGQNTISINSTRYYCVLKMFVYPPVVYQIIAFYTNDWT